MTVICRHLGAALQLATATVYCCARVSPRANHIRWTLQEVVLPLSAGSTFQLCTQQDVVTESALAAAAHSQAGSFCLNDSTMGLVTVLCGRLHLQKHMALGWS